MDGGGSSSGWAESDCYGWCGWAQRRSGGLESDVSIMVQPSWLNLGPHLCRTWLGYGRWRNGQARAGTGDSRSRVLRDICGDRHRVVAVLLVVLRRGIGGIDNAFGLRLCDCDCWCNSAAIASVEEFSPKDYLLSRGHR